MGQVERHTFEFEGQPPITVERPSLADRIATAVAGGFGETVRRSVGLPDNIPTIEVRNYVSADTQIAPVIFPNTELFWQGLSVA